MDKSRLRKIKIGNTLGIKIFPLFFRNSLFFLLQKSVFNKINFSHKNFENKLVLLCYKISFEILKYQNSTLKLIFRTTNILLFNHNLHKFASVVT